MRPGAGRTVLITGATRGAGFSAAQQLQESGAGIVLGFAHDSACARKSLSRLLMEGVDAELYRADVSDEEEVCAMFANLHESFGNVDVFIHAAGFSNGICPEGMPEDEWFGRLFGVWLQGARLCTREFVKQFDSPGQGRVVFLYPDRDKLTETTASTVLAADAVRVFAQLCRELYGGKNISFEILPCSEIGRGFMKLFD